MARAAKTTTKDIESLKHREARRKHIPTTELESLVSEEERTPKVIRYKRNTDVDPQLVWRGKDEQDAEDLMVDAVPIYIQEKIKPEQIISDLKRRSEAIRRERAENAQYAIPDLYSDFNGLAEPGSEFDFYKHDKNWSNRMILGDLLLVMTSLAEKEALKGQVQCIYMDPPYGIRFNSNWQPSTKSRDVQDGQLDSVSREPEMIRAFRDTWRDGVHSYLSYLRNRLRLARELLTDSGAIFVQIGDENVHRVRAVMDEVFGDNNFVTEIMVKKKGSQISETLEAVNDFVLFYCKSRESIKFRSLFTERDEQELLDNFPYVEVKSGQRTRISDLEEQDQQQYRSNYGAFRRRYPNARLFALHPLKSGGFRRNQSHDFRFQGRIFPIKDGQCWKHTVVADDGLTPGMTRLGWADRIFSLKTDARFIRYATTPSIQRMSNWWDSLGGASSPIYVVQTNTEIVKRCVLMTTDPGDLVLDPTCGSGTTAYVAEQWGRRWITIDTSRVALALARQRVMAARYPAYLMRDSSEGAQKEAELAGRPPRGGPFNRSVRQGFVYEVASWNTSGSVANNAEIDIIWEKWQGDSDRCLIG